MGYSEAKITCSASIIVSIIADIYTIISESGLFFVSCNELWQTTLSYGIPLSRWGKAT